MYSAVLVTHSLLRYLVLILGLVALCRALSSLAGRSSRTPANPRWERAFAISLDVQLLLGLALYFHLSPLTQAALTQLGAAAHNPLLRFWAFEHPILMVLAVVAAHVGLVLSRKAGSDARKIRAAAACLMVALLLLLAGIPWPSTRAARPLWPQALGALQMNGTACEQTPRLSA